MRHTPGPWTMHRYQYVLGEPTRARIHGANGSPVVDDCNPSIDDARLIAAAPDLLAAADALLGGTLRTEDGYQIRPELIERLRAAIIKATI